MSRRSTPFPDPEPVRLASGRLARFVRDGDRRQLIVDGTPQSEVNLLDPTELEFSYVRHMGHVLDLAFAPRRPLTAVHLGAGAMTIPRYVEATRPGSRQQVIELERDLIDFVREHAPLPAGASIRMRYGDAREQLGRLPGGLVGRVDALVVDVFAGPQTPAHVTTVEFFGEAGRLLAAEGVLLANVADGHELRYARRQIAALREAIGPVVLVADPSVLKGRRFGNIVAAASAAPLELPGLARLAASGFPPAVVVDDAAAVRWLRGAAPRRDDDAESSPLPKRLFT
ncbi:MAG: fused MFS/spermidine synthase [Microbacteriaceae bacterium]|nr:fused MFS/spermidine synthase [Microbacteriaceae bacterium]